jgi:tubulin monoglycylase TTLL3/8
VQKYIETSMLTKCRKFDIRQWVLVTDWNPLTVWLYAEPYVRFAGVDFTFDNIGNRYAHLSNNSVIKHLKNSKATHEIEGNMWCLQEYTDWL